MVRLPAPVAVSGSLDAAASAAAAAAEWDAASPWALPRRLPGSEAFAAEALEKSSRGRCSARPSRRARTSASVFAARRTRATRVD